MAVRRNSTLRFALVGGCVAVAMIAALSPLAAAAVRDSVVNQEARRVTDQVRRLLSPSFTPEEFRHGLKPDTLRTLQALSSSASTVSITGVRLWNREGTLLYSNERNPLVQRATASDGLRAALGGTAGGMPGSGEAGRPFSAGTMYLSFEGYLRYLAFRERQVWLTFAVKAAVPGAADAAAVVAGASDGTVTRLYVPVRPPGASAPAGAFEVAYDFRPLERRLANLERGVWTAVPGGILALYCSMLVVVERTPGVRSRRRATDHTVNAGVFRALANVVDARDSETGDHSGRVASYALAIAHRLRLPHEEMDDLKMAAGLHDIGKISVPDAVLMKPGPLTAGEWGVMRRHALVGSQILDATSFSDAIKQGVRHAHEWWNGRGYPDRLRGEQIPLSARILAVADAFEAMTSSRPYRRALTREEALAELRRMRGVQFDPNIVDLFCEWVSEGLSGTARG